MYTFQAIQQPPSEQQRQIQQQQRVAHPDQETHQSVLNNLSNEKILVI